MLSAFAVGATPLPNLKNYYCIFGVLIKITANE